MDKLDSFVAFLNKAYFMSVMDKSFCYEYASKSLYLNELVDFLYRTTDQVPCYTPGNPCSNVVLIYENQEEMDDSFKNHVREQIMQQSLDQSLVYVTCINKVKYVYQSMYDTMVAVLLNEITCVNPKNIVFVAKKDKPSELFEKAKKALRDKFQNAANIYEAELLQNGEINTFGFDIITNGIIILEKERGKKE